MRARLWMVLSILAWTGCDEDPAAVQTYATDGGLLQPFADVELALRCDETGGCSPQSVAICGVNEASTCFRGTPAPIVQCEATRDLARLTLAAQQLGPTLAIVRDAQACSVTVITPDGAVFRGACSEQPPAPAVPCQLSRLTPRVGPAGILTVEGDLFCQGLRGPSGLELEVTGLGDDQVGASSPGHFVIANCGTAPRFEPR